MFRFMLELDFVCIYISEVRFEIQYEGTIIIGSFPLIESKSYTG